MEASTGTAASLRTDSTAPRRLLVAGGGLVLGAVAAGVLSALEVDKAVSEVIVPAVPGFLTVADEALLYRRSSKVGELKSVLRDGTSQAALPLAIAAVLALLFFERVVLLLLGASGAIAVWLGGQGSEALTAYVLASSLGALFVLLPMSIAMVFVARYMAHRIASNHLAWMLAVVVAVVTLDIVILAGFIDYYNIPWDGSTLVIVYLAMAILLLSAGTLGTAWAHREKRSYVLKRLFSRLTQDEQEAVIELVTPS